MGVKGLITESSALFFISFLFIHQFSIQFSIFPFFYLLFLSSSGILVSSKQNTLLQNEDLILFSVTGVERKITGTIQTKKYSVGDWTFVITWR